MKIAEVEVKDYVTKSNLPFCDYVINPYVGCPHGCRYCYASFMKRFSGHEEPWGEFLDVKRCAKPLGKKRLTGKAVFLASVTDPYNPYEKRFEVTRSILEQLAEIDCRLYISTKSSLILRDLDLLKCQHDVIVDLSINTLDDAFRRDMDRAASIPERLRALSELHEAGIRTVLFMSPIFPGITDWRAIVEATRGVADEYWFENLNLRGAYKADVMGYVRQTHSDLVPLYEEIFTRGDKSYWLEMEQDFTAYCEAEGIAFTNAFHHAKLVAAKKAGAPLVRRD